MNTNSDITVHEYLILYLNSLFGISIFRRRIHISTYIPLNVFILPEEFSLDLKTTDFPSTFSIVEDTTDDDVRDDATVWETKLFVFSVFEGCCCCNTPC